MLKIEEFEEGKKDRKNDLKAGVKRDLAFYTDSYRLGYKSIRADGRKK